MWPTRHPSLKYIDVLQVRLYKLVKTHSEINTAITGLIVNASPRLPTKIETSTGEALADIEVVKDLMQPLSTGELKDLITKLT